MSFTKLILKNPFRKKSRAALSIGGIMIGIMVIILLGSIATGLTQSMSDETSQTEFFIMNNSMESYGTPSNLKVDAIENISSIEGINKSAQMIQGNIIDGSNSLTIEGMETDKLDVMGITSINGTKCTGSDEILVGKLLAEDKNKKIGDKIKIKDKEYKITGIYEMGEMGADKSVILPLDEARDVLNFGDDEVFLLQVSIKQGYDITKVKEEVKNKTPDKVEALSDASELESVKYIMDLMDGATLAISILAIIIGGLGVINTMLMSVMDRTKEIGLLKAIGWSRKRIIFMILSESVILTTVSFILASIFSIIILYAMEFLNIFTAAFPPKTFIIAFIVALLVGLLGGFYPALRASKFEATEALRYE